jgi:hypothetical protein
VFEKGLVLLLSAPDDQYALALYRSFAGLGTDDAACARALGSNDKPDIARIAARYVNANDTSSTRKLCDAVVLLLVIVSV